LEKYLQELKQADTPPVIFLYADDNGKGLVRCSAYREGCPPLPAANLCEACHVAAALGDDETEVIFIYHDIPRQLDKEDAALLEKNRELLRKLNIRANNI
jgi:hypothetical protein